MNRILCIAAATASLSAGASAQDDIFEQPYWTERPVIEAMGRAQIEVMPNRARFSVSFVETDKDSDDAMALAVERARAAYETIKTVAGDEARVTTSVSVSPYFEQYRDRDGDRIENRRADKVAGYEARASLNVVATDTAKAGNARAAALALGPQESGSMSIYLEETTELLQQAHAAAVADASARARLGAEAAGTSLGRLLVLQEGYGPCLGQWTTGTGRTPSPPPPPPAPTMAEAAMDSMVVTSASIGGRAVEITQDQIDALNLPTDPEPRTISASVCAVYSVD